MEQKQQPIDRFTRQDELLAQMIPILRQIRDKSTGTVGVPPAPEDSQATLNQMLELMKYQREKNYEIKFFTYPNDGTRASLTAGTTLLNFENGTIKPVAGAISNMSNSLSKLRIDFLRSVAVNADKEIVVQLDNDDKIIVKADTFFVATYQQFTKLRITTTETTNVFLLACTNPEAIVEMLGESTVAIGKQSIKHIDTDKDTNFTTAIAQNAIEEENIAGLSDNKITITGIAFQAKEALNFRLWLYDTDGFADTDLDLDQFNEYVDIDLSSTNGQIAGAGQYYYALTALSIDYEDEDATNELHLALQNLSAASKTAGAAGEVKMKITYKPRL